MPITPDMPPTPDDDEIGAARPGRNARRSVGAAANDGDTQHLDDAGDIFEDEMDDAPAGQSFSEMVREAPVGAVIGAFVAGFLVARIL